jgi:hypothetical protein
MAHRSDLATQTAIPSQDAPAIVQEPFCPDWEGNFSRKLSAAVDQAHFRTFGLWHTNCVIAMQTRVADDPGRNTAKTRQGESIMASTTNLKHKEEERMQDKGREMLNTASEMASSAGQKASDVASTVGQKAEDATAAVGGSMKSLAGTIREKAPEGGVLGSVSSSVAHTLEDSGRYLEEHGLSGIGKDMAEMVRRNPLPALLVGIGLGYLLARATRS